MKVAPKVLLIVAEFLFLCSLFLPALETVVLGKPVSWEGWRATAVAVWALSDVKEDPTLIFLASAGLGNVVFLVAPWLLLFSTRSVKALRVFAGVVAGSVILALWAPHSSVAGAPKLLVGYFAWLLAYMALLGSVALSPGSKKLLGKERQVYA